MTAVQIFIKAAALPTLWLGAASATIGTAAAAAHGNIEPVIAVVCVLFAIFAQCTSNILHRYYDEKNGYGENRTDRMVVTDEGNLSLMFILKEAVKVSGILTATAGLALLAMAGWWTLIIAAMLIAIAMINNMGKHPLSRSVLYPISTFLVFGPIGVIGTELVQSQHSPTAFLSWWDLEPAVILSVMAGLMAVNCHVFFGMFHRQNNRHTRRTTFFGRYGHRGTNALLIAVTIVYAAVGAYAPHEIELSKWLGYLPVPILSAILNFYTIYLSGKAGKQRTAWRISLLNIAAVAVATLVIFWIIGYPYHFHV